MRWIIFGAVLGLLLVCPSLLAAVAAIVVAVACKPVVVAFGLGLTVRARLPHVRRWTP